MDAMYSKMKYLGHTFIFFLLFLEFKQILRTFWTISLLEYAILSFRPRKIICGCGPCCFNTKLLFYGTFAVMSSHIPLRRPERFWIDILHIVITSSSMPNEIRSFWTPIFWHRKTICTSRPNVNKRDANFRI